MIFLGDCFSVSQFFGSRFLWVTILWVTIFLGHNFSRSLFFFCGLYFFWVTFFLSRTYFFWVTIFFLGHIFFLVTIFLGDNFFWAIIFLSHVFLAHDFSGSWLFWLPIFSGDKLRFLSPSFTSVATHPKIEENEMKLGFLSIFALQSTFSITRIIK